MENPSRKRGGTSFSVFFRKKSKQRSPGNGRLCAQSRRPSLAPSPGCEAGPRRAFHLFLLLISFLEKKGCNCDEIAQCLVLVRRTMAMPINFLFYARLRGAAAVCLAPKDKKRSPDLPRSRRFFAARILVHEFLRESPKMGKIPANWHFFRFLVRKSIEKLLQIGKFRMTMGNRLPFLIYFLIYKKQGYPCLVPCF